jgi:aminoglycoside phosphotransferase (APT) family kinase protein
MVELVKVRERLAAYLGTEIAHLQVLASGWETTCFEFAVGSNGRFRQIPARRPLVLRFYQGSNADEKGPREYRVISELARVGYLVPRPYHFEGDRDALDAPFMIMDRLEGGPLLQMNSFPHALKTFSLAFFSFVRAQTYLHQLSPRTTGLDRIPRAFEVEGASKTMPLLDRVLHTISDRVERGPLPALRPMLEWANRNATRFRENALSVLHLDYHPLNVLVKNVRVTGIIDWVNTDIGDRHLDAAMTAAILSSSAFERPRWLRENIIGNSLRKVFASLYVPLYHALAPLDFERFRYYQAVAALLRLSMLGMIRTRGPETVGFRPEAVGEVTPAVVNLLSKFAARKSGVPLRFEFGSFSPA